MMDLQPEMQDILRRNGMQAHVVSDGTGYRLVVQGHDSPLLTYDLTERQMLALTDWGTNSANKKAYNVFTSIVGKDFYMPKNFVHDIHLLTSLMSLAMRFWVVSMSESEIVIIFAIFRLS